MKEVEMFSIQKDDIDYELYQQAKAVYKLPLILCIVACIGIIGILYFTLY